MPFLWIDALCILQDSAADWERESAKMGGIYATGFATIAADVGDFVNEGFLDITPTEAEEDLPYLAKVTSTLESGQQSTLVFWNASSAGAGGHAHPSVDRAQPIVQKSVVHAGEDAITSHATFHEKGADMGVQREVSRRPNNIFKHSNLFLSLGILSSLFFGLVFLCFLEKHIFQLEHKKPN
jgi:hypothetical protein